jgi:hypothetical protein
MKKEFVSFLLMLLGYSLLGMAYIHEEFVAKDAFQMIISRLDRIEIKLDKFVPK